MDNSFDVSQRASLTHTYTQLLTAGWLSCTCTTHAHNYNNAKFMKLTRWLWQVTAVRHSPFSSSFRRAAKGQLSGAVVVWVRLAERGGLRICFDELWHDAACCCWCVSIAVVIAEGEHPYANRIVPQVGSRFRCRKSANGNQSWLPWLWSVDWRITRRKLLLLLWLTRGKYERNMSTQSRGVRGRGC